VQVEGEGKERCQHCVPESDADRYREVDDGDIVEGGILVNSTNVLKLIGVLYDSSRYSVFYLVFVLYIQRRVCPKSGKGQVIMVEWDERMHVECTLYPSPCHSWCHSSIY